MGRHEGTSDGGRGIGWTETRWKKGERSGFGSVGAGEKRGLF